MCVIQNRRAQEHWQILRKAKKKLHDMLNHCRKVFNMSLSSRKYFTATVYFIKFLRGFRENF